MSLAYREAIKANPELSMREWCARPGRIDEEGNIVYFTEQHHAEWCNIKAIIKRYDKTGLLDHVNKFEGQFGDLSGADFKTMMDKVTKAEQSFQMLPSAVRNRFRNSVQEFLAFFENPENRDEAIKLGLIDSKTPADKDGIGEHIKTPKETETAGS